MNQKQAKRISIISFIFFLVVGSFTYGLLVGAYQVWPFSFLSRMKQVAVSLYYTNTIAPENGIISAPPYASRERVEVVPGANVPGFLAIMGHDSQISHDVIWLFDETGEKRHVWPIKYSLIDPDRPSNGSDAPHGFGFLPDGSVVVNFDLGDAMARFDTCGNPIWIKEGIFHHQIEFAQKDNFWTWQADKHPFSQFQYLVKVDAQTGKILKRISLKDDVILKSPQNALVFSIPPGFEFRHFEGQKPNKIDEDIFHPNDIEELGEDLAVHFPHFSPGDLLISLRHLHLVAVLDPETHKIKWAKRSPWRYQHDPDFTEDGTISVYDNNKGHQRSKIIEMNPMTMHAWYKFPQGKIEYNNSSMGTHQRLPNGGEVITIPMEGRVLMVNKEGEKTFEFNNILSEEFNANVQNALWLPKDFFNDPPSCEEKKGV